jgi:DNA polymerase sigma
MSRLGESIRTLHANLAAPSQQYRALDQMVTYLRSEIGPRVRASQIETFGSCSNGLWTKSSDADMTLIVPRCNTKSKIITKLKTVRDFVRKTTPCPLKMTMVENARIPVLKLAIEDPSTPLREIDISINNISGIENSLLVKTWASFDPRFIPLAFSIKHWAKSRDINDRAKGTLSTYTLLLQLVYIMRARKLLPSFSEFARSDILETPYEELNGIVRPTPFNTAYSATHNKTSGDEASLLRAFFAFFGDENIAQGAEILDGEITAVPTSTGALVMRCPLTNKDVNVMSASAWQAIHSEFQRARNMLRKYDDSSIDIESLTSSKFS